MRLVIQRVLHAEVQVDSETVGQIQKGLLVFVGAGQNDTKEIADKYLKKLLGLRIFEDENGKTNLSLKDVDGQLLLVSQKSKVASLLQVLSQAVFSMKPSFSHPSSM